MLAFDPFDFQAVTLANRANRLRCFLKHLPYSSRVQMFVVAGVGARHGKRGLSHFLEHLLCKKTERFESKEAADLFIEEVGGKVLNLSTYPLHTQVMVEVPSGSEVQGLEVLSQFIEHPVFEEEIIEKEREVIMNERATRIRRRDGGDIHNQIYSSVYGENNPLVWVLSPMAGLGDYSDIQAITIEDVREHYRRYYHLGNMALFIVGNFDHHVLGAAEAMFSRRESEPVPAFENFSESATKPLKKRQDLTDVYVTGDKASQHIVRIEALTTKVFPMGALMVLNDMAREALFDLTRRKHGNTYSPQVRSVIWGDLLEFAAAVATTGSPELVVDAIAAAFTRVKEDVALFERVRRKLRYDSLKFDESVGGIMKDAVDDFRSFGRVISLQEYLDALDRLRLHDVVAALEVLEENSVLTIICKTP